MKMLWNPDYLQEHYGPRDYEWFKERAERRLAGCDTCKGSGEVRLRDEVREHGWKIAKPRDEEHRKLIAETLEEINTKGLWTWRPCPMCSTFISRLERFCNVYFRSVPPSYRSATLSNLKPYAATADLLPLDKQQKLIDIIKAEPEKGYCFCGPAHVGKSHWLNALYADNLWRYHVKTGGGAPKYPVWKITTKQLLDQHTEYVMRRFEKDDEGFNIVDEPLITAKKIEHLSRLGFTYKLYLEEIDKIKETESRRAVLFELLDTLMAQNGVLVVNTNLRPEEMRIQFGEDFAWRIEKLCRVINLFGD